MNRKPDPMERKRLEKILSSDKPSDRLTATRLLLDRPKRECVVCGKTFFVVPVEDVHVCSPRCGEVLRRSRRGHR
jgi:hypothetical protein